MDEKEYVIILSDIHMGTNSPTVRYRKDLHEKYLNATFDDIIASANKIRELVLLGDIFEFWSYPPEQIPPTMDDIIATHPNILGPNGKLSQALTALKGRVIFIPGDHDMNVTQDDLHKIINADGYTIQYHLGAYIPSYDTSVLFAHGNEFCLFDAPYYKSSVAPLPFGYFLSRAISYRLEKELINTHSESIANLKGNAFQRITQFIFDNLSLQTNYINDSSFIDKLIDSIVYATGIPRNQYFMINKTTAVSLNDVTKIYNDILNEYIKELRRQMYLEQIIYLFTSYTDFNLAFLPYLARKCAIENCTNSVIVGHTHVSVSSQNNGVLQYANTGSMCPSISDMQIKPVTYGIYSCTNKCISLMCPSNVLHNNIQTYINNSNYQKSNNSNNSTNLIERIKTIPLREQPTTTTITDNQLNVPNNTTPTEQFTFGWSVYNASAEYFKTIQDGVLARAQVLGIRVITHDQKSDSIEMVIGCINLLNQNINALLISPFNPEQVPIIVTEAKKKEIPVVIIDVGTGGADVLAFIISDSFAGGVLAGEYALTLIKKYSLTSKNVAIIKVEITSTYALRRGQGFKSVMIENGYQVVSEVTANSLQDMAYEETKKILELYGDDLAVIFCENGSMTLGTAQAIVEAGKKGKIMVIGFDADPSIIAAINEGFVQGTIAQQSYKMGEIGVETAYSYLLGVPISYDDWSTKEILMEVYLIDESGNPSLQLR